MNTQEILDKIALLSRHPSADPEVPPPELIAFFIRWVRRMRQWKVSTLADFANVSVSTVERVERGERVGEASVDRIGIALGYESGYLTSPRRAIPFEQASAEMSDTFGHLEAVAVSPMRSQRKIREAANCQAFLVHRPEVPEMFDDEIETLGEWLDLASFILSTPSQEVSSQRGRRQLYNDILASVETLERSGFTVLSGAMNAPQDGIPDWKVAVISITPRSSDPGAIKRRHILVDHRCVMLPPKTWKAE
jgi:transcriptional regulator with XRE-family HTH domain